jgi:cytochrome c-type biogenesis protein
VAVTLLTAFFGGLLSFLSPCVLPLVPPYLCFITGATLEDLTGNAAVSRNRTILAAFAFVLGFATVFVLLGATASVAGQFIRAHLPLLAQLAGIFIILMGLHFLGVFRFAFLNREKRYQQEARPAGLIGAYAVGLAFAFGWTPCIGPILASILAVAGSETSVAQGALLLAVYSVGLGFPFILAAFAVGPFTAFMKRMRPRFHIVEKTMGCLLVLTGIAFLTGWIADASFWLLETFPVLGRLG